MELSLAQLENIEKSGYTYGVPEHTIQTFMLYLKYKTPPGSFGMAVLTNNLFRSFAYADTLNKHAMPNIVKWLYNSFPIGTWGSSESVNNWLNGGDDENA